MDQKNGAVLMGFHQHSGYGGIIQEHRRDVKASLRNLKGNWSKKCCTKYCNRKPVHREGCTGFLSGLLICISLFLLNKQADKEVENGIIQYEKEKSC